eukprot:CAMPEP_0205829678 /NCGR_PEP_ID=MMETSP0206-20130828/38885_1 /ASSEMBLY_ACC=CAM_ASM_000279 /TAXON_ID=36767 /ORGANISM="Euplotes focardii, Strain TN1" /LENGTH=173 /DNA_ID=CAMNT_0053132619 /DNA_START=164 /DNA_END=684 /DNA_ORIENTATION=+
MGKLSDVAAELEGEATQPEPDESRSLPSTKGHQHFQRNVQGELQAWRAVHVSGSGLQYELLCDYGIEGKGCGGGAVLRCSRRGDVGTHGKAKLHYLGYDSQPGWIPSLPGTRWHGKTGGHVHCASKPVSHFSGIKEATVTVDVHEVFCRDFLLKDGRLLPHTIAEIKQALPEI